MDFFINLSFKMNSIALETVEGMLAYLYFHPESYGDEEYMLARSILISLFIKLYLPRATLDIGLNVAESRTPRAAELLGRGGAEEYRADVEYLMHLISRNKERLLHP